jgi:hypothetical protein
MAIGGVFVVSGDAWHSIALKVEDDPSLCLL